MRAPPLTINGLEPPDCSSFALNSVNLTVPAKAYIVPKTDTTPNADDIIDFCRKHLAAYKVPRAVQFVDDLPKTSTGKLMWRELRTLDA